MENLVERSIDCYDPGLTPCSGTLHNRIGVCYIICVTKYSKLSNDTTAPSQWTSRLRGVGIFLRSLHYLRYR